uniref:Putative kazal-type inhibitor n=1 Tax=Panstrongylus lignarius TaxID=156445 RepID=A0A224Y5J5_9HEMI
MKVLILCLLIIGMQMIGMATAKCNCNCRVYKMKPICGREYRTNDFFTFPNVCHLQCYNCTHNRRYIVIRAGDC